MRKSSFASIFSSQAKVKGRHPQIWGLTMPLTSCSGERAVYGDFHNRGPRNGPQHLIILIVETPQKGPLIIGKPHMPA